MSIKVRLPYHLVRHTGGQNLVEATGTTVGEVFRNLERQFPGITRGLFDDQGRFYDFQVVYVNRESWYPEQLAKPVEDGDEISIVAMMSGG